MSFDPRRMGRRASVSILLFVGALLLVLETPLKDFVEKQLTLPVLFQLRQHLSPEQELDSRIKVFAFDDRTFQNLQNDDLNFDQWVKVLQNLAAQKPRVILIDKYFGSYQTQQDLRALSDAMQKLDVPVTIGSFATKAKQVSQHSFLKPAQPEQILPVESLQARPQPASDLVLVGPHPDLKQHFSRLGHINYKGYGFIQAVMPLQGGERVIHLGLAAAKKRQLDGDGNLFLDDHQVPLREGDLLINLKAKANYAQSVYSLLPLLKRAEKGVATKSVQADDIVVLLPKMFTGNTDYIETPLGPMPGGYLLVALVESYLSQRWFTYSKVDELFILGAGLFGLLLGFRRSHMFFLSAVILSAVLILSLSLILFSQTLFYLPWFFPVFSMLGCAWISHAERNRQLEKRTQIAESSLEGRLSPQLIGEIRRHPEQFDFRPTDRRVSVMFVDLVNFARATNALRPRDVFQHLRSMIQLISRHVHEHGGIVDNVIGDGVLCFFGYDYNLERTAADHAERAVRCAVAIQRSNYRRIEEDLNHERPVLPIRIGINTTTVHFGDLGGTKSIRPTLVGAGVNLAARLESSCESFRILLSETSLEELSPVFRNAHRFYPRQVSLKHYKGMFSAWEVLPLDDIDLSLALDRYQKFHELERYEERLRLELPDGLQALVDGRMISLVNISQRGMAFQGPRYYGKDVFVQLELRATGANHWQDFVDSIPSKPLYLQIVWGYPEGSDRFRHGARFLNLPPGVRQQFIDHLQRDQLHHQEEAS